MSSLYLAKNQTYRGQCLLIFDQHVARPDQLSARDWGVFCADLYVAQGAITRTVRPDHINVEALGNVVPHLHWHIVPRYWGDARWGAPTWLTLVSEMADTRLPEPERRILISKLQTALAVGQATEQNTAAG